MMKKWLMVLFITLSPGAFAEPLKTVSEFTAGMEVRDGFIPIAYDKSTDKVYLIIKSLDTPMLFQSSMPQGVGSNDIGLDRGQLGDTRLVQFSRFGNKVLLKQLNTRYRAQSDNLAEQQSIDEAFADSVIAGFTVAAADGNAVAIDYTAYLLSDIHGISKRLQDSKQGSYSADAARSAVFMPRSKAFEKNTELESVVTFAGDAKGDYINDVTPDAHSVTVHLHHSFVELPEPGYEPRTFHPYSGFWKFSYLDYATAITAPMEQKFIIRHRLAKKDPDAAKSEPVEPIIYYLDPGIPEPVMSALKEGASWWDQAFEAAGYVNAFQVKVLPDDADPMDIRYNVIQWVHRATRGWSYGASVVDPRTGELLKGHVTLGSLRVRQDYLIALGLTSPFGADNTDTSTQEALALARIRQLSAHEVGHTLGLAHNFAASEDGRESVMDYPHPLLRMEQGRLNLSDAYDTGIGEWDKHAIAYGYQDYAGEEAEKEGLASIISEGRKAGLHYKTDDDTRSTASASANGHMWDNGEDPIQAFEEISALRKQALDKIGLDTIASGQALSAIEDALVPVYLLHRYQLEAIGKQVGGVLYEYERKGDYAQPKGVKPVPAERQKRAIAQMLNAASPEFLQLPKSLSSLIPPTAFGDDITREHFNSRMGRMLDPVSMAEAAAAHSLALLFEESRLNRLQWQSDANPAIPSPEQLAARLLDQSWQKEEADNGLNARLKMVAINTLVTTISSDALAPEVRASLQGQVAKFSQWLNKNSKAGSDRAVSEALENWLKTGEWTLKFTPLALPPGSPI